MSTIHSSWLLGRRSALRCGTARYSTVRSMAYSRHGRASTASPTHSRRPARRVVPVFVKLVNQRPRPVRRRPSQPRRGCCPSRPPTRPGARRSGSAIASDRATTATTPSSPKEPRRTWTAARSDNGWSAWTARRPTSAGRWTARSGTGSPTGRCGRSTRWPGTGSSAAGSGRRAGRWTWRWPLWAEPTSPPAPRPWRGGPVSRPWWERSIGRRCTGRRP
jgi:hypothetical protein